jgi:hypothetical protein
VDYLSRSDLAYEMKKELGYLPYVALGMDCNLTMIWDAYAKEAHIQLRKDIREARTDFRAGLPQPEIKPMDLPFVSPTNKRPKQLSLFDE